MLKQVFAAPVDIGSEFGVSNKFSSLGSFISVIIFNFFSITGIIMLGLLIFGGISIIIGAGSSDSGKVQKGGKAISAAIAGFAIIFVSYFIIQLIQTLTGVEILSPNI